MKPLSRKPQNKHVSARQFTRTASRTKLINLAGATFRGGIRL